MSANPTIEFEIPANTPETIPHVNIFDLGIDSFFLRDINIIIPEGHKGLAFLRVETPGWVLVPSQSSNVRWIRGDRSEVLYPVYKKIEGPPYKITCIGYNEDLLYEHKFILYIRTGE